MRMSPIRDNELFFEKWERNILVSLMIGVVGIGLLNGTYNILSYII